MDNLNRWQDRVEIVVGIWLSISAWVLNLPQPAAWCAIVVGIYVILLSVEDLFLPNQIEDWGNIVLGLGLMISPWAWGYADNQAATLNALVCGLLVSGVAFWALERIFFRYEAMRKTKHT